jgi:hypothetical protein
MLLTPADRGSSARSPGSHDPWRSAPAAEMSASFSPAQGLLSRRGGFVDVAIEASAADPLLADASLRAGGCFVRQLPLDNTCASAARRFFREAVAGAGLPGDLIHDAVTMASELAANTMNAHGNVEFGGRGRRPVSGMPEIWLYLRTSGPGRELVCKIFDSEPGWDAGEPQPVGAAVPAGPDSVRGRGLQLVAGLSAGRWGHHLSRGRLGAWKVAGKAVWFALRVPPVSDLATSERLAPRGSHAIAELVAALADRGLGAGLVPVTEPGGDMAVLSVSHELTVWCRGEIAWWREPAGSYDRIAVTDLVEATERIVAAHEELCAARAPSDGLPADEEAGTDPGDAEPGAAEDVDQDDVAGPDA